VLRATRLRDLSLPSSNERRRTFVLHDDRRGNTPTVGSRSADSKVGTFTQRCSTKPEKELGSDQHEERLEAYLYVPNP